MSNSSDNTDNGTRPPETLDQASVLPLILMISLMTFFSLIVTHRLLRYFARVDTPFVMKSLVGCSWFMGIAGVLVLLPTDLVGEFYEVGPEFIVISWKIVYWVTFALAWIICPVAQEYHAAGHFSFRSRLWEAIKSNVKTYLIIGLVLVIAGGGLAITRGLSPAFVVAAVNVYGLFLIIIMLGYGIVEVPMAIWRGSDPVRALQSQEFRAGGVETNMIDAEDRVDEAVEEVVAFRRRLGRGGDEELIKLADQVLELAPRRDAATTMSRHPSSGTSRAPSTTSSSVSDASGKLDVETLANLNRKLKRSLVAAERARWDWDDLLERTSFLEKLLHDRRRIDPTQAAVVLESVSAEEPPTAEEEEDEAAIAVEPPWRRVRRQCRNCTHNLEVRWYTHFYRVSALLTGSASIVLFWCAVVSPFSIHLSLFGKINHDANDPMTVFVASFLPLLYMSVCVYTALFKFKYLDALALHGNRQTDAYNLLYNASYMGRLQFSLGVVYFQMLYPQDSQNTAFHHLVGDMDTVPFLGSNFNQYSPFFILFFAFASLFNCGDRLLDFLGISTHRRPRRGNREHEERIEEGRRLIAAAKQRRERERRRVQNPYPTSTMMMNPMARGSAGANGMNGTSTPSRDGGYARVEDLLDRL
jgi:hypothetical protein